ncbi:hypothetical protein BSKO_05276 [Bryopsis sp. KO-2023]|nr:hypothetical protein BSKO_05276 [Bryopsis sp. KO-2023]
MISSQAFAPVSLSTQGLGRRAVSQYPARVFHVKGGVRSLGCSGPLRLRHFTPPVVERVPDAPVVRAAADADPLEGSVAKVVGAGAAPTVVTGTFIALWYAVNVAFNLTNKSIYKFFPYPWTVSTIHVLVGTIYCGAVYLLGAKKASFGRPINGEEFRKISGAAVMHALGHIAANVSFAAVAISLSHTVKTLEPAFNCLLSFLIMGKGTPLPVIATLVPIIGGVGMACAAELSFNWLGFLSAMASNLTFGFRAVWGKRAIATIDNLDSTAVYAYTTLISLMICLPLGLIVEGPTLMTGAKAAIEQVGARHFYTSLASVGLFYHLYNQFAFNTLQRVNPVSHGVCNVVKRIVIIGTSVVFFGNVLTAQTKIGTCVALFGTYLYVEATKRFKPKPQEPEAPVTTTTSPSAA